jgi:hypothetical protein
MRISAAHDATARSLDDTAIQGERNCPSAGNGAHDLGSHMTLKLLQNTLLDAYSWLWMAEPGTTWGDGVDYLELMLSG